MANVVVRRKPLKGVADHWPELDQIQPQLNRSTSAPSFDNGEFHHHNIMAQLPSKRENAFATVRMRNQDNYSFYNTVRGWMTLNRIAGDMERGLSDASSEVDDTPLDLDQIKELPVSMAEKRDKLYQANMSTNRSGNTNELKWKRRKLMRRVKNKITGIFSKVRLFKRDMKKIEGDYGSGVVAYFVFIKWLTILNFFICVMMLLFITVPTLLGDVENMTDNTDIIEQNCCISNVSEYRHDTDFINFCHKKYVDDIKNKSIEFLDVLQDIVQGTGRMEYTVFFHGYYENTVFEYFLNQTAMYYNFPMAYMLTVGVVLFVSLFAVVRAASRGFNFKYHDGEEEFYQYCNLIFGGWDFCIDNDESARRKKVLLTNEIQACLDNDRLVHERKQRTVGERRRLIFIRVVINLIHLGILGGCGYGIYRVFQVSTRVLNEGDLSTEGQFLFEFLPSITIVFINTISPIVFKFLIVYEKYSPNFSIFILLGRTVFLRLASIIIFYVSMYQKITKPKENNTDNCLKCWETFVGQQIYRLAITDLATHIVLTFFVNYPRAALAKRFGAKSKIIKIVGEQTFDLPKHVLDVVYTQTLCWLGLYFAPMLPVMFVIIFILMFYIKKFVCLVNSSSGSIIHRTSRSKFMVILLIAFIVAVVPICFALGEMDPSISCGPFRDLPYSWLAVYEGFEDTPDWLLTLVEYIPSPGVSIALFILLVICLYYYTATINANRHMVKALKTQLVLEGYDKQLLMNRLAEFYKQQQQLAT